jgi:hypothetical protein
MTKIALFSVYKIFWTKCNNRKCFSYLESLTNLLQFLLRPYLRTGKCYGVIYSWKYGNLHVKIWHASKQAYFDVAQVDHDNVTLLKFTWSTWVHVYISMLVNLYPWHLILFHLFIYLSSYLFIYLYTFIHSFIYSFTSIYTFTYFSIIVKCMLKIWNCKGKGMLFVLGFLTFCFNELINCSCWNVCN